MTLTGPTAAEVLADMLEALRREKERPIVLPRSTLIVSPEQHDRLTQALADMEPPPESERLRR